MRTVATVDEGASVLGHQGDRAVGPDELGWLDEPLLDAADAASLLKVKPSWVYDAVRHQRIPHVKVGRHIRFVKADLARWVKDMREDSAS